MPRTQSNNVVLQRDCTSVDRINDRPVWRRFIGSGGEIVHGGRRGPL